MTSTHRTVSANVMTDLYLQSLQRLDLLEPLRRVPFRIQCRGNGFAPAERCLALLASQAQRCQRLTDWTFALRHDSRLCHWMAGRPAPHYSTLSRSLAATDAETIRVLRRDVLVPLSDQAFFGVEATKRWLFVDVDTKGLRAEGATYEGTSYGRMSDGRNRRGYRLHLLSLDNRWPLEIELTGANEHGVGQGMVMCKRLMRRVSERLRRKLIIRGDSNYGCVRFVRYLQRYPCGYLLKGYNASTALKLWRENAAPRRRVCRVGKPDLLALECGVTTLTGMTREKRADGTERRQAVRVTVPRVVVYREDPAQVPDDKEPGCFFLITTLSERLYDSEQLLEAYLQRAGDIENIFSQVDQAFSITHLRSRKFYGNYTFLLLTMIAANLTQMVRDEAIRRELPIPAGLSETLTAAKESGLELRQDEEAGCVLHEGLLGTYATTFKAVLRCSYQHRFRYVA